MLGNLEKEKQKLYSVLKRITPGDRILIEIPTKGTIKTFYLGWYPDNFLLTTLPPFAGIKRILQAEPDLTLRLLVDGEIYSCITTPFYFTFKPTGMLFLREPFKIDAINLRKVPRVNCFFPASLKKEKEIEGVLLNLSRGGAAFLLKEEGDKNKLSPEDEVELKFSLPNKEDIAIKGQIKRFFLEDNKPALVIVFLANSAEDKANIDKIDKYIKNILTYLKS